MDQLKHTHGGARPGAGRKSADRMAALAFGVDLIVQLAIAQERVALYLKQPERDPTVGELRQLALARVQSAFQAEFGAA